MVDADDAEDAGQLEAPLGERGAQRLHQKQCGMSASFFKTDFRANRKSKRLRKKRVGA
jgi:hypothetical protein